MSNTPRHLAGWLCIALGFALVVLLGLGMIDPTADDAAPASLGAAFAGLLPFLLAAVGAFVIGLVLLRGGAARGKRK